jgi:hypothetical protein
MKCRSENPLKISASVFRIDISRMADRSFLMQSDIEEETLLETSDWRHQTAGLKGQAEGLSYYLSCSMHGSHN